MAENEIPADIIDHAAELHAALNTLSYKAFVPNEGCDLIEQFLLAERLATEKRVREECANEEANKWADLRDEAICLSELEHGKKGGGEKQDDAKTPIRAVGEADSCASAIRRHYPNMDDATLSDIAAAIRGGSHE